MDVMELADRYGVLRWSVETLNNQLNDQLEKHNIILPNEMKYDIIENCLIIALAGHRPIDLELIKFMRILIAVKGG